jgi:hypothetical protein
LGIRCYKKNRGISISIPEPDEEDNKETLLTNGKSLTHYCLIGLEIFI